MNAKNLSDRLNKLRDEELSRLADNVENNEKLSTIYARIRRIEGISRFLERRHTSKPGWGRALVIGLLAIGLVSVLWLIKIEKNNIRIKAEADAIDIRVKKWAQQEVLFAKQFRFAWIDSAEAAGLDLKIESHSSDAWLKLQGHGLILRDFEFEDNTYLMLYPGENSLDIFANDGAMTAFVEFESGQIIAGKAPGRTDYFKKIESLIVPETIIVRGDGKTAVPLQLTIRSQEKWQLDGIKVAGLSFSKERTSVPESGLFESSLKRGTVALTDIGKKIEVSEHDNLILRGVESRRFEVEWDQEKLKVSFEGAVEDIHFGPESLERDLRPSILEYLYYRKPLVILWGAVTFLWSFLWGVRQMFTSSK